MNCLWWRPRWQRTKFAAVLPSNLPGAIFSAKFTALWRKTTLASPRVLKPVIRSELRRQAGEVTKNLSVLDVVAARDAVLARVAEATVRYDEAVVEVRVGIGLRADPDSKRIAEQHVVQLRELRLSQEAVRSCLLFLRDEVFAEPALGGI